MKDQEVTQADTLLSGKCSIFDYYMFVRAKFVEMSWQETCQWYVQVIFHAKIRRKTIHIFAVCWHGSYAYFQDTDMSSLQCKVNYRCIERCKKRNDQSQFSMQMNTIKKTNSVWCADVSMLSLLLFIIIVVVWIILFINVYYCYFKVE